jgi:hypothetical protein
MQPLQPFTHTSLSSTQISARPAKPGIWIVLLFVFLCGMTFSSSAATRQTFGFGAAVGSREAGMSFADAAVYVPSWSLFDDDAAGESASLAFLGFALIGAAGCWRRVIRGRVAQHPASAKPGRPRLRAVPRPGSAS